MLFKIKNRIERELSSYVRGLDKAYPLRKLSPLLSASIKEFIARDGKRIRPLLFCIGYLGFSRRTAPGLFRSALSLELLHDFMLIHDDIIDKSAMRRGKPSMHALLNRYFKKTKGLKFSGEDLAIIIGDVIYALALDAFLAVKEEPKRKEEALKKLISAALYTGSGEFMELLLGTKPVKEVTRLDVYKIYDFKTANYTFASPLTMGALLGGADKKELKRLFDYGILLGRAFQIKDDIIGTFATDALTGKSNLTDIKEAKRTLLIWYAYNHSDTKSRQVVERVFSGKAAGQKELSEIREIISCSGALDYARKEIKALLKRASRVIRPLKIRRESRQALNGLSQNIFDL
ncbi:MAG: polyprenyl synthetase family protein [Candidatus Omnitrophota bacterium]